MPVTAQDREHDILDPAILYFGTPVCLLSTLNEDGSANLAPMSSVLWLGSTAVLGMGAGSQTSANLLRTRECVLNLPSVDLVGAVDRLALTTGSRSVPPGKVAKGYRCVADKFDAAGLTPAPAIRVDAPRVRSVRSILRVGSCRTDPSVSIRSSRQTSWSSTSTLWLSTSHPAFDSPGAATASTRTGGDPSS